MKTAIVNSFFPPWRGGAETYVSSLAHALKDEGNEVTVLCADAPRPPGTTVEMGVTVKRHRLIGRVYGTPIMPGLIQDLLAIDADIFHANFPSPYIASLVAWISKHREVPAVLTWHNDLPPVTSLANVLIRLHDNAILPNYIHAYRRIIATTRSYARESPILSSLGTLTVIPNGVNCNRFNPKINATNLKNTLGLENRFTIIFVGALTKWHRYKGLDVLLHAMKLIVGRRDKCVLLVIGEGELKKEYQLLSEQLGITGSTIFLGDVSDTQLPTCYAASDLLVLPSKDRSEGFGLTLLEANASGKPVVASRVGGTSSVVKHNYNGLLVSPNDADALSKSIFYLLKNQRARLAMGRNARMFAQRYDWKRIARLTQKVYSDALSRSP